MSRPRSKSKARINPRTQPVPMSSWVATFLLTCLWATLFGLVCGGILYAIGKLPSLVAGIASSIYGVIFAIVTILGAIFGTVGSGRTVKSSFRRVWGSARRPFSLLLGAVTATVVTLTLVIFNPSPAGSGPISILSNAPSAPLATLAATKWHPLLKQTAPNCHNPKGTAWFVHMRGTFLSCSESHLLMQRISPQYYADMELVEVNGSTYSQTAFRVQVQITFQNPSDTGTLVALLVQTPAALTAVGGYYFVLNSEGQWQLQSILTGTDIPTVEKGSVTINPNKPVLMAVTVKEGLLVGYINGQPVVWYNDNLNPSPGQVGLDITQGPIPSSPIFYSNFELDV